MSSEMHRGGAGPAFAAGLETSASIVMIIAGFFDVIGGISGIAHSAYYAVSPDYVFRFKVAARGWAHLIFGALLVLGGSGLLGGRTWARTLAIALDILVIWAIVRESREFATT